MTHKTTHKETLVALRRATGQLAGVQRMIGEGAYCIDIINQLLAAIHALYGIASKIFTNHLKHCVREAFASKSEKARNEKMREIITVVERMRR